MLIEAEISAAVADRAYMDNFIMECMKTPGVFNTLHLNHRGRTLVEMTAGTVENGAYIQIENIKPVEFAEMLIARLDKVDIFPGGIYRVPLSTFKFN